jgi:hypothetical protein
MVLAALASLCTPKGVPIDLLNVAFENPRTAKAANKQQQKQQQKINKLERKQKKKNEQKQQQHQQPIFTGALEDTMESTVISTSDSLAKLSVSSHADSAQPPSSSSSSLLSEKQITTPPNDSDTTYNVPDRLTGQKGVEELRRLHPDRCWRFVEIDVPFEEAVSTRAHVLELMAPLQSVMDLVSLNYHLATTSTAFVSQQLRLTLF